jgi:flagellar biosynthesis anti-sigma factor FlgM
MTTPVDGNSGAPLAAQIDRAETTRTEHSRSGERGSVAGKPAASDRVEVSADAALMREAVQAVDKTPDVRQEKVEAAKKALADGTLGADAGKLADALLSHMTDELE